MPSLPFIHIRSGKFPKLPGEDEELINEGMYGKALASYLQSGLRSKGYDVPGFCCEDWGWWVGLKGFSSMQGACIYCIAQRDEIQEYCVCVGTGPGRKWSWKRFRFIDTTAEVKRLDNDLRSLFTNDPEIEVLGFPENPPLIQQE